jgi:N-methylhydantoinase B
LNKGLWRPIRVVIPEGTILTPASPAAVGVRYATGARAFEAVLGALSKACDDPSPAPHVGGIIPAAGCGLSGVMGMSVFDESVGERIVTVVAALGGGSGARPVKDAVDGTDVLSGARNIPAEVIESELPVVVRHCRLRADGPAAGRWRGGLGRDLCIEARVPNSILTARGWERSLFRPWGRAGGKPGNLSEISVNPGTPRERSISKIDVLRLGAGDAVRFISAGGAGYGDPLERDPDRVLVDVLDEYVTVDRAREDYGVVITNDAKVDTRATVELRRQMRPGQRPQLFDFGPERERFERIFPGALHDQLLEALQQRVRPEQRHYYLDRAYGLLTASGGEVDIERLLELLPVQPVV